MNWLIYVSLLNVFGLNDLLFTINRSRLQLLQKVSFLTLLFN